MLSIIIVSWNVRNILAQCLDSISQFPPNYRYEVWVVDNASTDGTCQLLDQEYPDVHLLENPENVGFAQANNQAIEKSTGKYVLLLNPDTVICRGALSQLVEVMEEKPRSGAVGSLLLNPDRSFQTSCYPFPTLTREFWRLLHLDRIYPYGVYAQEKWDRQQMRQVDVIQGASLLLRRSALDQVGLLDPGFFMYTEEVDLCFRLKQAGWESWWVPQAEIIHYGGQSTHQVAGDMFIQLYQSKIRFFRKNYGRLSAMAYKCVVFGTACLRLAVSPFAWLINPSSREENSTLRRHYARLVQDLPGL